MSGAAVLAGRSALRSGAGLVAIACPKSIQPIVAAGEPSYMTVGLDEEVQGRISDVAVHHLETLAESASAMAFGPGISRSSGLQVVASYLYHDCQFPLVVDADGLNNLVDGNISFSKHSGVRILTPHPGEFARMTGISTALVQSNRKDLAADFAKTHGVILVLKGAGTVVTDGESLYINDTGNAGMATGGTGDVLTGLMTGLLAQGMPPFDAAVLGVWVHGRAGDLVRKRLSAAGLIASDLPDEIASVFGELEHRDEKTNTNE